VTWRALRCSLAMLAVAAIGCGPVAPTADSDELEQVADLAEQLSDAEAATSSEVSCSYSDADSEPSPPGGTPAAVGEPHGVTGDEPLDELDLRLAVNATSVAAGCEVTGWLLVTNRSGGPVTERACELGLGRYALVPADASDAELWIAPIATCQGPTEIADGFEGERGWFTFFAAAASGEPLTPGDYVAVLELDGWSGRFELPIVVVP
jgi:hypothetical protein